VLKPLPRGEAEVAELAPGDEPAYSEAA
jgi:hypothetical protein